MAAEGYYYALSKYTRRIMQASIFLFPKESMSILIDLGATVFWRYKIPVGKHFSLFGLSKVSIARLREVDL
jgi:hypothetical protein